MWRGGGGATTTTAKRARSGGGSSSSIGSLLVSSLRNMPDKELVAARMAHLETLRRDILPSKRDYLDKLRGYAAEVASSSATRRELGPHLCEQVFYEPRFEFKPHDYHKWDAKRKDAYEVEQRRYRLRFKTVIPYATYAELAPHEQERLQTYIRLLVAYISLVEDTERDIEVAFGRPHPERPDTQSREFATGSQFSLLRPPLYSRWDVEVARRKSQQQQDDDDIVPVAKKPRRLAGAATATTTTTVTGLRPVAGLRQGVCLKCGTDEFVVNTIEHSSVCTQCGSVGNGGGGAAVDESIDAIPFDNRGDYASSGSKGAYEMTANFLKTLDLVEATPNNKVPGEVTQFVARRLATRIDTAGVNLIRHTLKQGGYQKHYPAAVCILSEISGNKVEQCTAEEKAQMKHMHEQYVVAFLALSRKLRQRKSSLTNGYLITKFYQMMGLLHRLRFVRQLKCPKKRAEHDRVFRLIIQKVRETSDAAAVAAGNSYWQWFVTPSE